MFEFRWNFAYHLNDTSVSDVAARSRRTPSLTWPPTSVAVSHFDFSLCCGQLVLSSARGGLPLAGTERGEGTASRLPPTKSGGRGGCTGPCGATRTGVASSIRDRKHTEAEGLARKGAKRKRQQRLRWKKARQRRNKKK